MTVGPTHAAPASLDPAIPVQTAQSAPAKPSALDEPGIPAVAAHDAGPPEPPSPVRWPRPATIAYQAYAVQQGRVTALASIMDWRHDGQSYDLRWRFLGKDTGQRNRTATGSIRPDGLMPVAARATASGVEPRTAEISASDAPAADALLPGAQLPMSVLIETGARIAGNPAHYPVGSRIEVAVADGDSNGGNPAIAFTVADDDDFAASGDYDGQRLSALHLVHQPLDDQDARVELWLARTLDYLPAGLLIVQPGGTRLGMTLVSAQGRGP